MTGNRKRQLIGGALLSYIGIAFSMIVGLVYTPWMLRQIGKSNYGIYTLAISAINLFTVNFGLGTAITKFVSKARAKNNQEQANAYISSSFRLYLIVDAVIAIILTIVFFLIERIYQGLTIEELRILKPIFLTVSIYTVFSLPLTLLSGILTASEQFIALKLSNFIHKILGVLLTVIALTLGLGVFALVLSNVINGIVMYTIQIMVIKNKIPIHINIFKRRKTIEKEIALFCVLIAIQMAAQRLIFTISPSILGVVSNSAQIAVFGIITTLEGYSYNIISAISGMFMPKITDIVKDKNDGSALLPLLIKVGRLLLTIYVLLMIGFSFVGKEFIRLWAGSDYIPAYYGLILLLIPGLFQDTEQIAMTAIVVMDRVKEQAKIMVIMALINISLSFPLSYFFGAIGTAISIVIAYSTRTILLNLLIYKKMKIDIVFFWKQMFKEMSIPVLITVIFSFAIKQVMEINGWFSLGLTSVLIVFVYLLSIYFLVYKSKIREYIGK